MKLVEVDPTTTGRPARGAWLIFTIGAVAYLVTVLNRTSLSATGIDASTRYGIGAGTLSSFAVLQLLVYSLLQVPVGVLIDRWGPRRLVVIGAVTMALGQFLLSVSTDVSAAVLARVLVGAGDAMTFVSVLRICTNWFPPQRVPVITQLIGLFGQLGQVLSLIPLVALLNGVGWTTAYASAGSLSVLAAVLSVLVLRDVPPGARNPRSAKALASVASDLRASLRHPGTRLGLWAHFTLPFAGNAFALLWGYPFLVSGEGLSPRGASSLLTVYIVSAAAMGPVLGRLVARHPLRRSWLVLAIVGAQALTWTAVLVLPGHAPLGLLVVLVLVIGAGVPGSLIGFDYARSFNPADRLGGATGMTNVMGFMSSVLVLLVIGLLLDAQGAGTPATYSLDAFRVAFAVQLPVWLAGTVGILVSRRQTRALLARDGVLVPSVREAIRRDLAVRRARS